MSSQYACFDKEMTSIVKGFAILFMMILHCYDPALYDVSLDCRFSLVGVNGVFKICVGMFTFMVGYGYAFSKNKDLKYSLQHIRKLLIPFWVILFVFTFPICFKQLLNEDFITVVYNLFGIDSSYNWYSWFVYFFIFAMIVMPIISRFINKRPLRNLFVVVIAATLLSVFLHEIPRICSILFGLQLPPIVNNRLALALFNCLMMVPGMSLGYLFAHQEYYEHIRIDRLPKAWTFVLCCAAIVLTLILRHLVGNQHIPFQEDFFFAPVMIGSIVILFNVFEWKMLRKIFIKLGTLSVYMWFFHALFFTPPVKYFYQPAITVFDSININFVVLWTIFLTFCVSWILKSVVDWTTNRTKGNYS